MRLDVTVLKFDLKSQTIGHIYISVCDFLTKPSNGRWGIPNRIQKEVIHTHRNHGAHIRTWEWFNIIQIQEKKYKVSYKQDPTDGKIPFKTDKNVKV